MHELSGSPFPDGERHVCCPGLLTAAPALKVSVWSPAFADGQALMNSEHLCSQPGAAIWYTSVRTCSEPRGGDAAHSWAALWSAGPGDQQCVTTVRRGAGPR